MSARNAPVKPMQEVELTVDRLAYGGKGVARHDGFVVFVQRGLPGDTVRARVRKVHRRHAEAIALEVLERGPDTQDAPCGFHARCGGCAWQGLDYGRQAQVKRQHVIDALERLASIDSPPVQQTIAAVDPYGYRNKMEYTFTTTDDGRVSAGFHEFGRWDSVVPIDMCLIADPSGRPAHSEVSAWANENGLAVYDPAAETGCLRTLVIRTGRATGEVQVQVVTGPGGLPNQDALVERLKATVPGLVSVVHSTSSAPSNVLSDLDSSVTLAGRDWFEEELAGIRLRVRAGSFLQPNTVMAERLYAKLRDLAQLRPDDVAWDLYCGIGSISLMLAREVRHVFGVEVVEQAIECARENAELNGITNVEWRVGNVRPVLKFADDVENPTIVVVDPPRSGISQKALVRMCARAPERIMYVSCNPTTFASDVAIFAENGYDLTTVVPVDQFPHTYHVETVARLDRRP